MKKKSSRLTERNIKQSTNMKNLHIKITDDQHKQIIKEAHKRTIAKFPKRVTITELVLEALREAGVIKK